MIRSSNTSADMTSLTEPQYLEDYPLAHRIFQILGDYLRGSDRPQVVVQRLTETLLPIFDNVNNALKVCYLWGIVLDIVKQLSPDDYRQGQLVEILLLLREEPPPSGEGRGQYEDRYALSHFWKTLPHWRAVWSEFETDAPLVPPKEARKGYMARQPDGVLPGPWRGKLSGKDWMNLNAFMAHLHAAAPDFDALDHFALRALLEALEQPHDSAHVLDDLVPAAACWIIYAGTAIKHNTKPYAQYSDDNSEMKGSPWSVGELYRGLGLRRFCPERWNFWRERFVIMQDRQDLDAGTRTYAVKALQEMERLDVLESSAQS